MNEFIQRSYFFIYFGFRQTVVCRLRKLKYKLLGMDVGFNTYLPKIYTTFPNQVSIGNNCLLEENLYFKYDGIWKKGKSIILGNYLFIGSGCEFNISHKIIIGDHSAIASGCKFIDHDHGIKAGMLIGAQSPTVGEIIIGEDVWLGCNVIVLKGISIGSGAVVAAGAVVTKSIPANEIWGGVPAKKIGSRV